jgi:hypothetical protein
MLILAHVGITLGAAVLLQSVVYREYPFTVKRGGAAEGALTSRETVPTHDSSSTGRTSPIISLAKRLDIRFLLIGSLLPDIIDKPVGHYLFTDVFSTGRIFSHTCLFVILLTLIGLLIYRRRGQVWLLVLAFGSLIHLMLDEMWLHPRTLLWPLLGFNFEQPEQIGWLTNIGESITQPSVLALELIGAALLIWLLVVLVYNRQLTVFIRRGRLSRAS